jgi:hypothetical protein
MELKNDVRYVFKKRDNIYTVRNVDKSEANKDENADENADELDTNAVKLDVKSALNKDIRFTATVVDILCNEYTGYKTLRVKEMIYENNKIKIPGMVTMPYDWIESAYTCEDI